MDDTIAIKFDWIEYSVFSLLLGLSSLIGLYFGCIKGGQDTISGYLLGGKQMTIFPIAMSLTSSYISGITLLGVPTEMYTFGTQYLLVNLAIFFVVIFIVCITLPVFYKLQLISLYEYMEMRFNRPVRLIASFIYIIGGLTYLPIVIYGSALALSQVSDINLQLGSIIICAVCIFYTSLGGLKAVVWSDTLQGMIMIGSLLVVIFLGTNRVGGFEAVYRASIEGERIEFLNMNMDPTKRLTFWSSTIGLTFYRLGNDAMNPSTFQRFISLPTFRQAQVSSVLLGFGLIIFNILSGLIGLIVYANYRGCDPLMSNVRLYAILLLAFLCMVINSPEQIVPHFVLTVAVNIKGLSGIFLAGIICASLSTVSTYLNTMAGIIFQDFLEPLSSVKPSERKASLIIKFLVAVFGVICILMIYVVEKLGTILEMTVGFSGVTNGTVLGIFLLGILFPWANTKGALCGGVVSIMSMMWILVGTHLAKQKGLILHEYKPLSIENCTFNITSLNLQSTTNIEDTYVFPLYRLTTFYYALFSCLIVLIIGLNISLMTGPNHLSHINPDLIHPFVYKIFFKKHPYDAVRLVSYRRR